MSNRKPPETAPRMMHGRRYPGLLLLLLLLLQWLSACSPAPVADKRASATGTEQGPVFDLARVKQQYKGQPLKVLDISERNKDGRNALAVTLSVPLDPGNDQQSYFNLSRKDGTLVDGAWVADASGKVLWFSHTEPKSAYEITIYQGLTAGNGVRLGQNVTATITTRDLQASVNFDTNGTFLPANSVKGLPLVTVNISEVNIDFFRIKADQVQGFLEQAVGGEVYHWNIDRITQYGDLVYSGRYQLDAPLNTRVKRSIDIRPIEALQHSGIYFAVMQVAGQYNNMQTLWFSVTDLGLHARHYSGHNSESGHQSGDRSERIDVHVSSLQNGQPLAHIDVSLLDNKGNIVKQSKTTPQGLASFTALSDDIRLIVAQTSDQYSVIETRKAALDLSEFELGKRPQLPLELFIYAPRDLFRPGERLDLSGLIRDGDGRQTKATVLKGKIKRPDGSVAKHFNWKSQSSGYYQMNWLIPADAPVGNWSVEVDGVLKYPVVYGFKVEEFLPERMKLSFNQGDKSPPVSSPGEALSIAVLGEYLYGAPAAGNRLGGEVFLSHWRSPLATLKNYHFGDLNETLALKNYPLDDSKLNAQGQGKVVLPSRWKTVKSPLRVRLLGSLYESGGRPVTRAYSALVWPGKSMPGIRSHFNLSSDPDKEGDGPAANSRVKFDIVNAGADGQLYPATHLDVKLIREDRQYFWVYNDSRGWHYDWSDKEFIEISQLINIQAGQSATVEMPVSYGSYRLEVSDPATGLRSSVRFYAGDNWYSRWQNANDDGQGARPDKVTLALDQAAYRGGDIAKVTLVGPAAGEAIVMVEGDGPLWMQRVSVPADGITLEIPVSEQWQQHNLYVTAVLLRGEQETISPRRSFGLIHLPLDRTARKLQLDIEAPEQIRPLQTLNVRVNVDDSSQSGQPANAAADETVYLTLAAVDVGVLSLSNFVTPDPFTHFFGRRRYQVQSRDLYERVIDSGDGRKARLRFGGDADISRGGKKPRSEVQIVSLFSGLVKMDNGSADIALKLPDFNGRLRLMAVAFSADRFGHGEKAVTVAAPVVTQINMPRFMALGDQATIALDINNLSGQSQTLTVDLSAGGALKLHGGGQNLTLADQQSSTLTFSAEAAYVAGDDNSDQGKNSGEQGHFDLMVTGLQIDGESSIIKRRWTLGVRPAYPALVKHKSRVLAKGGEGEAGETFTLGREDIDQMLQQTVEARLSLSSQADLDLPGQLQNLLQYPYGCLEQTASRVFPLLYADGETQARFGLKTLDEPQRADMIAKGIERIGSLQRSNGGFGLWDNHSDEEHWLSAFIGDFLLRAKDNGAEVPQALMDKTMKRLQQYLNRSGRFFGERWSEDKKHYNFAYKAYAGYVLSRVNQASPGSLRNLFERHKDAAKTPLPLVHLGLALEKMGDIRRGNEAIKLALGKSYPERHYYGDYGSNIRDKALLIHLLLGHHNYRKKAIELSYELANDLKSSRWLSTQERNALFLAGIALQGHSDDAWQAKLMLGAAQQNLSQSGNYHRYLDGAQLARGVSVTSAGEQLLFANAVISGYSSEKPPQQSDDLAIERQWYSKDGKPVTDLAQIKVGELLIVHLQVSAAQRTPDALVVDLIPAGFELENQNLEHAIKLDNFTFDGKTFDRLSRHTHIKYQQYRDDRFVAALDINRYNDANLFYLLRAVTPGTYKVPPPLVEDMYRPARRGVGETPDSVTIK